MADANSAQAINQVKCIVGMCDFFENPPIRNAIDQSVPVSMPPDPGSLNFDIPFWVGLGMVGLWAALDAFAERAGLQSNCRTCGRKCIVAAYTTKLQGAERQAFAELEDLRHLYAHNYAGVADEKYFDRSRHVLKPGVCTQLSCGAIFDGWRLCRKDDSARPDLTRSNPPYTVNSPRLSPQYAFNLSDLRKYSHTVQSVLGRFP
jgi:hypothetical protein